jgi:hypothetical protein
MVRSHLKGAYLVERMVVLLFGCPIDPGHLVRHVDVLSFGDFGVAHPRASDM